MTSPKKPKFGKDLEPTDDMIAKGKFGNGSYGSNKQALEVVRAEKKRIALLRKEERRAEYEARVVESMVDVADFQDALIQLGKKTAQDALKSKQGHGLDKTDLDVIAKALKASEQVSNRILGLASRLDDKAPNTDALSYLIEGQEVSDE
jgi:rRNA maturation endonuclease Nob1